MYKLYIPSGYSGQVLPLVVMLHGCTQAPDNFASGTRMNEVAEEQTFFVAYPAQAPAANALDAGLGPALRIARWSPASLAKSCATSRSTPNASMSPDSQQEARRRPSWDRSIGPLRCGRRAFRPGMQEFFRKLVPTILFHGDRDSIVHPLNGDQAIMRSKAGAELQTTVRRGQVPGGAAYTCTVHADSEGHPVLEHWLLHELGHGWSGGAPRFTPSRAAQMPAARWCASFSRGRGRRPDLSYEGWNEFELCHR